jgi:hypothetical protein
MLEKVERARAGESGRVHLPNHRTAANNATRSLNKSERAEYFNESKRAAVYQLRFAADAVADRQHCRTVFGGAA